MPKIQASKKIGKLHKPPQQPGPFRVDPHRPLVYFKYFEEK